MRFHRSAGLTIPFCSVLAIFAFVVCFPALSLGKLSSVKDALSRHTPKSKYENAIVSVAITDAANRLASDAFVAGGVLVASEKKIVARVDSRIIVAARSLKEIAPSAVLDAGWRALQRMVEFHRKEAADHYVQLRTPEQLKAESAQYSRNASTMPRVKRLNDVAYVKIPTFSYPGVARDVLSALSGSRGAVIDLRGNTGGYTNEAHILLSALLPSTDRRSGAPTVLEEEYSNRCSVRNEIMPDAKFVKLGVTPRRHMHMSTLVDGHTASAAERFGLTLQLHGHPMVANRGERTYGKFSRLKSIVLPECLGSNAHWLLRYSRSLFRPVDPATGKPVHESVVRNGLRAQIEVPPGENLALHAYRHVARRLRHEHRRQPQQKLAN